MLNRTLNPTIPVLTGLILLSTERNAQAAMMLPTAADEWRAVSSGPDKNTPADQQPPVVHNQLQRLPTTNFGFSVYSFVLFGNSAAGVALAFTFYLASPQLVMRLFGELHPSSLLRPP